MVRLGIIGTNFITGRFLDAVAQCGGVGLSAVYSRSLQRAEEYAGQHGAPLFFDSLDALASCPQVDAVYIASPNCCHAEQAVRMLEGKKHVLCEKPIASNLKETETMINAAKSNGVILLEAMRPVFTPAFSIIRDNLKKLGTIRRVTFSYCEYSSRYDAFKAGTVKNAFNPALSNASLLDIGVYCIHPYIKLFGLPDRILAEETRLENGFNGQGTILMKHSGMLAELLYSKIATSYLPNEIQGENGSMRISRISDPREVSIRYRGGETELIYRESRENDMYYELKEFLRLIETGADTTEADNASRMTMRVMDDVRRQLGIVFPADKG